MTMTITLKDIEGAPVGAVWRSSTGDQHMIFMHGVQGGEHGLVCLSDSDPDADWVGEFHPFDNLTEGDFTDSGTEIVRLGEVPGLVELLGARP